MVELDDEDGRTDSTEEQTGGSSAFLLSRVGVSLTTQFYRGGLEGRGGEALTGEMAVSLSLLSVVVRDRDSDRFLSPHKRRSKFSKRMTSVHM